MKFAPLALGAALVFTSCAAVHVVHTDTAAVVTQFPKAIYLRPFDVEGAEFTGHHKGGIGERPIRQSLAPVEFTTALKEELEKLAPARVLQLDEAAPQGWLVEGSIERVDAGNAFHRAVGGPPGANPWGRSHIKIHVRVIDLDHSGRAHDAKSSGALARRGQIIYEFDVAGGSRWSGLYGSIYSPSTGYATPFDYRNAAERIRSAINPDEHRYAERTTPTIR